MDGDANRHASIVRSIHRRRRARRRLAREDDGGDAEEANGETSARIVERANRMTTPNEHANGSTATTTEDEARRRSDRATEERRYLRRRTGVRACAGAAMTRSRETRANASAVRTARRAMERKPAVPDGRETWTPRRVARDWTRENALEVIERSRERAEEGKEERDDGGSWTKVATHEAFGRVPTYLMAFNRRREEEARAKNIAARRRAGRMDDAERAMLIENLRNEHAKLSASYQRLPFVVDTLNRRARKEVHEAKLERIERDIETLSAAVVFVGGR